MAGSSLLEGQINSLKAATRKRLGQDSCPGRQSPGPGLFHWARGIVQFSSRDGTTGSGWNLKVRSAILK